MQSGIGIITCNTLNSQIDLFLIQLFQLLIYQIEAENSLIAGYFYGNLYNII